jgi:hypothetical protein
MKLPLLARLLTHSAAFGRYRRDHETRFLVFRIGADHHRLRGLFRCAFTSGEVSHAAVPGPATWAIVMDLNAVRRAPASRSTRSGDSV